MAGYRGAMIDRSRWADLVTPFCALRVPANLGLYPDTSPAPDSDLTFMAKAVGYAGDVPVSTIVSARPRHRTLRQEVAHTAASLDRVLEDGHYVVRGADVARWLRGTWVLEEALTEEGHELLSRVVVPVGDVFLSVVVRVPRDAEDGAEVADEILASLEVADLRDRAT